MSSLARVKSSGSNVMPHDTVTLSGKKQVVLGTALLRLPTVFFNLFPARLCPAGFGRDGVETDACRRADEAVKRLREAVNYLCEYNIDKKYGFKFALEAKPNEPRADIYMATTGHYLGFIPTLDHPEMVGVNPEVAHEQMAGLNFMHGVAQSWEAGKLFHIDLNDQMPGRYDQDLRFGSANLKSTFWLVKFLGTLAIRDRATLTPTPIAQKITKV
jgi:xylose isomerase